MMAKIYFSNFDKDKINEGGWGCSEGDLYLRLTSPLEDNSIDALDECLDKSKFRYIGEIKAQNPNEAWSMVQNIDDLHELNNRSMMIGDVIVIGNKGYIVESTGFSDLSESQLQKFKILN